MREMCEVVSVDNCVDGRKWCERRRAADELRLREGIERAAEQGYEKSS
jgi:hypothetical protein